jgi:hypothetical protein
MKNIYQLITIIFLSTISSSAIAQTVGNYNLLIVNGTLGTDAQTELSAMGHTVLLENPANLIAGYNYAPYDAIIFMYDSPVPPGISEIMALNESCQLGIIIFRGENLISTVGVGNSVTYSSTDFTIEDNTHWITEPFMTGVLDLGFTYKTNITSSMPNTTILGSVETGNGSLVVHNDYKRVVSPYYGHPAAMPWSADAEILMDRIIAWAVAPCCAATSFSFSETTCFSYSVPSGDETYNFSGTQIVMDTIPNVCGADSVLTITLTLEQLDLNITASGLTLTADHTGATYQWINCSDSSFISGETNQSFTASVDGDYAVIVTDGACIDTSACTTIIDLGLNQSTDNRMVIFPNPTKSNLAIQYAEKIESVLIYNTSGTLVQSEVKNNFSVENLPSGIYFLKIQTENGISTSRFVKE